MFWYHLYFDEKKQQERGRLVIEQYFDHVGQIYEDKPKKNALYSPRFGMARYFKKALFGVCKDINIEIVKSFSEN